MERRTKILYTGLVLAILLYVLHLLANLFYLYWVYWWYDVLMHFLAGLTGGFATYWVLFHSGHFFSKKLPSPLLAITSVFICILIAGVAWEIFEYVNGI